MDKYEFMKLMKIQQIKYALSKYWLSYTLMFDWTAQKELCLFVHIWEWIILMSESWCLLGKLLCLLTCCYRHTPILFVFNLIDIDDFMSQENESWKARLFFQGKTKLVNLSSHLVSNWCTWRDCNILNVRIWDMI